MAWEDDERTCGRTWGDGGSSAKRCDACVDVGAIVRALADELDAQAVDRPPHWPAEEYRDHDFEPRPSRYLSGGTADTSNH
jgi:hypothetical protein